MDADQTAVYCLGVFHASQVTSYVNHAVQVIWPSQSNPSIMPPTPPFSS
jgi:hypothetical protein